MAPSLTFDSEALWSKSRAFIERGLRARDRGDTLEYVLWSALALELIGKSALAKVSPALVADPNHLGSLLFACGGKEPADKKSIPARAVFERLGHICPGYDKKTEDWCIAIANRRNAELHSGESPVAGLDPKVWVQHYWQCARIIVVGQGRTLDEWVGKSEASRIETILKDASKLLEQTVQARIERCRTEFDSRYPPKSEERKRVEESAEISGVPRSIVHIADADEPCVCPACGLRGWLLGFEVEEIVDGPHGGDDGWSDAYENVTTIYAVDQFRCPHCGLKLEGDDELDIVDLAKTFEREDTRTPEYTEEYGND